MSVESTTTIAGLNALWPQGTDVKAEGDDHIRLLKSVIKADAATKGELTTAIAGTVVATAQARSRIVNGAMQISQENGDTALNTNGAYSADQWSMWTSIPSSFSARTAANGPNGNRTLSLYMTTPKPSLAVGDYFLLRQSVEGIRVSDFQYGTASAKQSVLRFWARGTLAGTYSVSIRNAADDRSFLAPFTITANTWTEVSIVVPGDTTGTWTKDTTRGLAVDFCFACGTNLLGVAGWQSGTKQGMTGITNGVATANTFYIADVGLHLDPTNTGKAPAWVMPDEAQELAACQRYFYKPTCFVPTSATLLILYYKVSMRTDPAITGGGAGFVADTGGTEQKHIYQTTAATQVLLVNARM